jgi:hypothetical protein
MPNWQEKRQAQVISSRSLGYQADARSAPPQWKALPAKPGGAAIEIRPLEHTVGRRGWEIRQPAGGLRLRVWATGRTLKATPAGARPHGRDWTEEEIERGIEHAVARALASPVASQGDGVRDIDLTSYDLYAANDRI